MHLSVRAVSRNIAVLGIIVIVALAAGGAALFYQFQPSANVSPTSSTISTLSVDLELQKLAAAKSEGSVVVYGSLETEIMQPLQDAFKAKYGVDVQYFRASSTQVLDRVLTEVKSGNPQFDVVLTNRAPMYIMRDAGAFGKYTSPSSADFPAAAKDPNGTLQPIYRVVVVSLLFNTKLLAPNDAPKNYADLLDPKWKGKIVIPDPAQHGTTTQWLFNLRSFLGSNGDSFIKGLCTQNPLLVASFLPSLDSIQKGERAAGITYIKYVATFPQAPLDYVRFPTLFGDVHSLGLGTNAKHPNAGKVFIDYVLSRDGLKTLANGGEFVAVPGIYPPIKDAEKLNIVYMTELTAAQFQQWGSTFHQWLTSC